MTGFGTRPKSIFELFRDRKSPWLEYRGTSFAMGADPDVVTLANLFKHYNPNIKGASNGTHIWSVCWGPLCAGKLTPSIDQLNAAQSGAMVMNLRWQVNYLVEQVRNLSAIGAIDIAKDYKYLTLWAGNNDLCLSCTQWTKNLAFHPDIFEMRMRKVLELIRLRLPRTVVNVMGMMNISQTYLIAQDYPRCWHARNLVFPWECPCASFGKYGNNIRQKMDDLAAVYNDRLQKIVKEYQSKNYQHFAVVYDPGMAGLNVREAEDPGMFFSPLDCFHPSLVAHQMIAGSVWKNLFLPSDQKKPYSAVLKESIYCPSDESRIQTH